jgi:F-type H+-transporting ATPase subunit b
MDDRDLQIKTDLENSKSNAAEVEGMLEEANSIIAQAKKEAFSIREKAKAEAMDLAETKFSEAKVMMDSKYEQFINTLADEKVALEKSLVSNLPLFKEGLKAKLSSI